MNLMTLQYDIVGLLRRKELENTLKNTSIVKTLILVVSQSLLFKTRLTPTTTTTNTHFKVKNINPNHGIIISIKI